MGKYLTVLGGMAAIAAGTWGLMTRWPLLLKILGVLAPLLLLVVGVFAVLIGCAEIRDSLSAPRIPPNP